MSLFLSPYLLKSLSKLIFTVIVLMLGFNANAQSQMNGSDYRVIDYQRIHLNVENLDASISAYQNVLGMELFRYRPLMNGEFLGTDPGSKLRTASLRVPGGDFEIELIEWTGSNHLTEMRDFNDPGMIMFSFQVNDFDAKMQGLDRLGWTVISADGLPVVDEDRRSIILKDANSFFIELIESANSPQANRPITDVKLWMTVNDLSETAHFYNDVFGFSLPLNAEYERLSSRQVDIFNTPEGIQYRMAIGEFPGLDFPEIWFQEFSDIRKRQPLRHRVQDYGGPTIPIVVRENDLRQTLIDMRENGGIIGQESISLAIPEEVNGTWWVRDPNGILYQVEAP